MLTLDATCKGARWVLSHNGEPWHGQDHVGTAIPCPDCNLSTPPLPPRATCLHCVDEATFLAAYGHDQDVVLAQMESQLADVEAEDVIDFAAMTDMELLTRRAQVVHNLEVGGHIPHAKDDAGREMHSQLAAMQAVLRDRGRM